MIDLIKKFKTRNGKEVVLFSDQGPNQYYRFVGYIKDTEVILLWNDNGISLDSPEYDLIDVKENLVVNAWINIIENVNDKTIDAAIYLDEEYANKIAGKYSSSEEFKILLKAEPYTRDFEI